MPHTLKRRYVTQTRIARLHSIAGKVSDREVASMVGRVRNRGDDRVGNGAGVEGIRSSLGQRAQRRGKLGIAQNVARGTGAAGLVEEVATGSGGEAFAAVPAQQKMQARRHLEALGGELDSRGEQSRPRQAPVRLVQGFERAQGAGNADTQAAEHGIVEGSRLAVDEEAVGLGGGRRRFPPVQTFEGLGGGIPM